MKRRSSSSAVLLVVLLLLVLLSTGGAAVVVATVSSSRKKFLSDLELEVARQLGELRPDLSALTRARAARILAAQAALESGYGSTRAYREGFNFGNVSAGSSWKGATLAGGDLEYGKDGTAKKITQAWRKYPSLAAAVSDFFSLLSWSRYQPARDRLFALDADGYAAQLRAGGYYTAPLAEYQKGLRGALAVAESANPPAVA